MRVHSTLSNEPASPGRSSLPGRSIRCIPGAFLNQRLVRRASSDLHHPDRGFLAAEALLKEMARQWRDGLPMRLVCKVLRKRGVHPWSLLLYQAGPMDQRLREELRLPVWAEQAWGLLDPSSGEAGFTFKGGLPLRRLPEGLVTRHLTVWNLPRLERLPRRLWTQAMVVRDVPRLCRLPVGPIPLELLALRACPRIRAFPKGLVISQNLEVSECAALEHLPRVGRGRRPLTMARLDRLPQLRRLGHGSWLTDLWIWRCPSLEGLKEAFVRDSVLLHRCDQLRTWPRFGPLQSLEVTDCPVLSEPPPLLEGADIRFEPNRKPLPALRTAARSPGIPPLEVRVPGPSPAAWPWPPPTEEAPVFAPALLATLATVVTAPLSQLRLLVGLTSDLPGAIRQWLRAQPDPPRAVTQAAEWLRAMEPVDRPLARQVLAQVEALGLGAHSVAHFLDQRHLDRLDLAFEPDCLRSFRGIRHSYQRHCGVFSQVRGPLVLTGSHHYWGQRTDLRTVEGPLWVAGTLTIRDCPYLESLPECLVVEGDLYLSDCPRLGRMPERLEVHGTLSMSALPALSRETFQPLL